MSYRPITHCPECGEPHDVYAPGERCEDCRVSCPRCGSTDTVYASRYDAWNCVKCGSYFVVLRVQP